MEALERICYFAWAPWNSRDNLVFNAQMETALRTLA